MAGDPQGVRLADRSRWRALAGGSICRVWLAATVDGEPVVVKDTPYPAAVEAEGLAALAAAGAPVPQVLEVADDRLVLEHVTGPPDWERLGARVAALHRDVGEAYGWHRDNLIGRLAQPGGWHATWPEAFAELRLRPLLATAALPEPVRARLRAALDGPLQRLLPDRPPASLVHGDLWSGNVVAGRWLIDPAVWRADRELELAFTDLFGGVPQAFWAGYADEWPLAEDWALRRPALQLYHLLVHVAHFGGGWVAPVVDRLDELGW